jgi:hypothetical protein
MPISVPDYFPVHDGYFAVLAGFDERLAPTNIGVDVMQADGRLYDRLRPDH